MAGRLSTGRFPFNSLYAWACASVSAGTGRVPTRSASEVSGAPPAAVARGALERVADALRFLSSAAGESAIGRAAAHTVPAASVCTGRRAVAPRAFGPCFERIFFAPVNSFSSCVFPSGPPCISFRTSFPVPVRSMHGASPSLVCGSSFTLGRGPDVSCAQLPLRLPQRGEQEEEEGMPHGHRDTRKLQEQEHAQRLGKHEQGRQQRAQGEQHQRADATEEARDRRVSVLLAVSPMLFTQWDETSNPKNELIFLAGNTLGYCTEKFFENEYGQSIFAFALGLAYLALLGYEGKVNGAAWRMKHVFGTNMRTVGHPRYAYALPQNPLLGTSKRSVST